MLNCLQSGHSTKAAAARSEYWPSHQQGATAGPRGGVRDNRRAAFYELRRSRGFRIRRSYLVPNLDPRAHGGSVLEVGRDHRVSAHASNYSGDPHFDKDVLKRFPALRARVSSILEIDGVKVVAHAVGADKMHYSPPTTGAAAN